MITKQIISLVMNGENRKELDRAIDLLNQAKEITSY